MLDSERPFERTSSGEYAVSLVSDDPWGEAGSLGELGLLMMREDPLDLILSFWCRSSYEVCINGEKKKRERGTWVS